MKKVRTAVLLALVAACSPRGEEGSDVGQADVPPNSCRVLARGILLPAGVAEASAAAPSRAHPGIFWTHEDSGSRPELFALRADGSRAGRVKVSGAKNQDWEDAAVGPCPAGTCVYIADVGDNARDRPEVVIWRVPEPEPGAAATKPAEALRAVWPDGPRDAEAVFVLPDGSVHLVTKGDRTPVEVYRLPPSAGPSAPARLERVRVLSPAPEQPGDRVTGAGASPDGRWVALRTYRTLLFFPTADLLSPTAALDPLRVDLTALGEEQGEGVGIGPDGRTVTLTSEGRGRRTPATTARLLCNLR